MQTQYSIESDSVINDLKKYDKQSSDYLRDMLFGDKLEKRAKWEKLYRENPVFIPKHQISFDEQRQHAYQKIKAVADAKLFSIFDFQNDPVNLFTCHEMLAQIDACLVTKFTVQFNLFGGSLMALHTERHLDFMKKVDSLEHMGCFCFTELGYGNNAPKMETTATYDQSTDEFIINSPTVQSQKYWITNGACHANYAIVFAQTIVNGQNEGINSFVVQIRDSQMKPCKDIFIEDMGHKMGMNGVDNGRLSFNNVRIKREQMLNKLNDVTNKGEFISKIKSKSARFFKVADRLLSGRLCIASMNMGGIKKVLDVSIKYSQQRLAAGVSGESDTPIMSYQLQQNAILPLLARTIVFNFGLNSAKLLFANQEGRKHEVIKTLCVVKAMLCWHNEKTSRICRERCGGGSYLMCNIIPDGIFGSHSGMTAEGDNKVLMQKVVKDLMIHFRKGKHVPPQFTKQEIQSFNQMEDITSFDNLKNLIFLREIFELRNFSKLMETSVIEQGKKFFDVWMSQVNDEIQSLAECFGERYFLQSAINAYENDCKNQGAKQILEKIIYLHMISLIEDNLQFYLINNIIQNKAAEKIFQRRNEAVKELAPHMNDCVESLGVFKIQNIHAPIARDYIKFNSQTNLDDLTQAGPIFDFTQGATQSKQFRPRM